MNKTTKISIAVIALFIVVGGAYASMETKKMQTMNDTVMPSPDTEAMDDKAGEGKVTTAGSFEAYAPEKLARAESGDVVLFFHASWCPSCRGLTIDLEKNLDAIPSELSILKVDYDTEIEMRKKYGVTYQHTLVQVDKDGNLIKKWSGSPTLSSLVREVE